MKYVSTRDPSKHNLSFSEVLLAGLAPDGGLYIPTEYPKLDKQMLKKLRTQSYADVSKYVIPLFIGDSINESDVHRLLDQTYSKSAFQTADITPLTSITPTIYLQDLSQGPSLAFKDLAMQFLGNIIDFELHRQNRRLTILGASSGDTVSAAEEAMKGKARISVVMLTPKTGMSPFQKAQAGSILEPNIFNLSVPGPFDICQDIIKEINLDLNFKSRYSIGAVNSINWGRICAQIVYYVVGWLRVTQSHDDPVDVVVPSGNFGNVLAGYIAKKMGLPIRRLIVSTNENKVLDTFFKTGLYKQKDVIVTSSPSMDISKASNIERYFFDVMNRSPERLAKEMKVFEKTKCMDLSQSLSHIIQHDQFFSSMANHEDRKWQIKNVHQLINRVIDPHTAAGIKTAFDYVQDEVPIICMETAKPTKFEQTVKEALGFIPDRPKQYEGLELRPQRFYECEATVQSVKSFITNHLPED